MSFFSNLRAGRDKEQTTQEKLTACNNRLYLRIAVLGYVGYMIFRLCKGHLAGESEMSTPVFLVCVIGMSVLLLGALALGIYDYVKTRAALKAQLAEEEAAKSARDEAELAAFVARREAQQKQLELEADEDGYDEEAAEEDDLPDDAPAADADGASSAPEEE